ncbi:seipin-like isoform X2 [Chelmon rostratus]|uniref:seipin-like isoform X2 n=1 Tax=Chelmon rostratus TaxID=109905 RepID=UPI001BED33F7|nr:seipin-like isoform X2 [Chelmon rostratus]
MILLITSFVYLSKHACNVVAFIFLGLFVCLYLIFGFAAVSGVMDQESYLRPGDDEPSVLIGRALLRLQYCVVMAMLRIRQRIIQSFVVLSFVFLLLWTATFLYGSFYYSYMPKAAFSTDVHYYHRTDCDSPASFLCSYPMANISLMRNKKRVLTVGQAYQISLQLEMPDSLVNQELGMFMIKIACFSQDGGQVASSARSTMLRYRSDLLRYLGTLLFLPAFLSGVTEQKQVLEVELFSDYMDDPYVPSATAVIEILSNRVQIYSSHLYIHAHFTGIRYLLFNFPLLSALVGVSSNFVFLSLLLVLSYMRLLRFEWGLEQFRTDGLLSDRENNMNYNQQEDEKDAAAGAAELLGPLQITPTNLSQEKPHLHFGDGTEVHNR